MLIIRLQICLLAGTWAGINSVILLIMQRQQCNHGTITKRKIFELNKSNAAFHSFRDVCKFNINAIGCFSLKIEAISANNDKKTSNCFERENRLTFVSSKFISHTRWWYFLNWTFDKVDRVIIDCMSFVKIVRVWWYVSHDDWSSKEKHRFEVIVSRSAGFIVSNNLFSWSYLLNEWMKPKVRYMVWWNVSFKSINNNFNTFFFCEWKTQNWYLSHLKKSTAFSSGSFILCMKIKTKVNFIMLWKKIDSFHT